MDLASCAGTGVSDVPMARWLVGIERLADQRPLWDRRAGAHGRPLGKERLTDLRGGAPARTAAQLWLRDHARTGAWVCDQRICIRALLRRERSSASCTEAPAVGVRRLASEALHGAAGCWRAFPPRASWRRATGSGQLAR